MKAQHICSDNHDTTEKHTTNAIPWTDSKRVTHDKFEAKKIDTDTTSNCTGILSW